MEQTIDLLKKLCREEMSDGDALSFCQVAITHRSLELFGSLAFALAGRSIEEQIWALWIDEHLEDDTSLPEMVTLLGPGGMAPLARQLARLDDERFDAFCAMLSSWPEVANALLAGGDDALAERLLTTPTWTWPTQRFWDWAMTRYPDPRDLPEVARTSVKRAPRTVSDAPSDTQIMWLAYLLSRSSPEAGDHARGVASELLVTGRISERALTAAESILGRSGLPLSANAVLVLRLVRKRLAGEMTFPADRYDDVTAIVEGFQAGLLMPGLLDRLEAASMSWVTDLVLAMQGVAECRTILHRIEDRYGEELVGLIPMSCASFRALRSHGGMARVADYLFEQLGGDLSEVVALLDHWQGSAADLVSSIIQIRT